MSNTQELMRTARAAIGDSQADDWRIDPTAHAQWFERDAPTLADNLRRARPEGLARMFVERDQSAISAQAQFKKTVRRANVAIFWAGSFAALLVVAIGLKSAYPGYESVVIGGLGIAGILASSLAAMLAGLANRGALAERWASERAGAEARRLAYFKNVMEGAKPEPLDQLLAMEYTRRFLLDSQIEFFKTRGRQHDGSASKAARSSAYATFIASALTGVGSVLSFIKPDLGVVAGVSAIASHMGVLIMSRSEMDLDAQNADRYRKSYDALSDRRLDLDVFRRRIADGNIDALADFYEPIFKALKADHKAFLSSTDNLETAIGDMQARIDEAQKTVDTESQDWRAATSS